MDSRRRLSTASGARTGVPRSQLSATATSDEVIAWLATLGLLRFVAKFVKKNVDGPWLFAAPEKKLRKLVKPEDDFVLFHRALKQAKAFAETQPMSPGLAITTSPAPGGKVPFRSVRRKGGGGNDRAERARFRSSGAATLASPLSITTQQSASSTDGDGFC